MGDFEQFSFPGYDKETVYAYVVKPVDFDPARKYPVALLIHGGPQGSFGNTFHYRWNPQVYAGAGYAALMIDFHGSVGYGQAFTDSIRDDWGGKPLEDLKRGLEAAIARYPWMDGDRVGALGASYGGYMVNWIAGQWPDRFRCLVNHDGNLDERMAYFDTDELWFPEWEHVGTPWTNPEGYEKQNPVNYVGRWKTPMLVIHGAKDYRIADSQGIGTFNALQRMGIPSKLLYFPDENHWVLAPHNSILWHETVIGWLDQWLKADDRPHATRIKVTFPIRSTMHGFVAPLDQLEANIPTGSLCRHHGSRPRRNHFARPWTIHARQRTTATTAAKFRPSKSSRDQDRCGGLPFASWMAVERFSLCWSLSISLTLVQTSPDSLFASCSISSSSCPCSSVSFSSPSFSTMLRSATRRSSRQGLAESPLPRR